MKAVTHPPEVRLLGDTTPISCASVYPPHPSSDIVFLGAYGINVDGGGGELGVPQPFLHQVERDAGGDGGHAEAMAQPLGRGVRPIKPGASHDRMDRASAGHPAPQPQTLATPCAGIAPASAGGTLASSALAATRLQLADVVRHVERVEQGRGHGTAR